MQSHKLMLSSQLYSVALDNCHYLEVFVQCKSSVPESSVIISAYAVLLSFHIHRCSQ